MRKVFRSTTALLLLGIALAGCNQANDPSSQDSGTVDNTVIPASSSVVLTVSGMA